MPTAAKVIPQEYTSSEMSSNHSLEEPRAINKSDFDVAHTLAMLCGTFRRNDVVGSSQPQSASSQLASNISVSSSISSSTGSPPKKPSLKKPSPQTLPITPKERHIPSQKKKSRALTFPEKLMTMLDYAEEKKAHCIMWLPSGNAFLVRDPTECAESVIPLFFKVAKFSSFTRKLYRYVWFIVVVSFLLEKRGVCA